MLSLSNNITLVTEIDLAQMFLDEMKSTLAFSSQ